jgi:transcriptional regulator with XRE-family HTH domain
VTEDLWRQTLAERRRSVRLTQQKLADAAGVSVGTISSIERGTGRPSRRVAESIEIALLSVSYRQTKQKSWNRVSAADIRKMFDRATVTNIDLDEVMAYMVHPA